MITKGTGEKKNKKKLKSHLFFIAELYVPVLQTIPMYFVYYRFGKNLFFINHLFRIGTRHKYEFTRLLLTCL